MMSFFHLFGHRRNPSRRKFLRPNLIAERLEERRVLATLTGAFSFSSDANGSEAGGQIWDTVPGFYYNLWFSEGTPNGNPDGLTSPFLNGPTNEEANIDNELKPGENHFTVFAAPGSSTGFQGFNFFFDGGNLPGISAFASTRTGGDIPNFGANSGRTFAFDGSHTPGAGTMVYTDADESVMLTDFFWAAPNVFSADRVTRPPDDRGGTAFPDGRVDFVGSFTLAVSEPVDAPVASLTGAISFSSNADGSVSGGQVWDTVPGFYYNLWLSPGTPGGTPDGFTSPFLNGPTNEEANIRVELLPGDNQFTVFGAPGSPMGFQGFNLFFNGSNRPGISVVAPTWTGGDVPDFSANSGNTFALDGSPSPGTGTLVYSDVGVTITLTDFFWATPDVYSVDRVMRPPDDRGGNALPDGRPDFVGSFTLVVTAEPVVVGDSNLDGQFNSRDLVAVFQAGKYETGQPATWSEGDWNRDGVFNSSDLVAAFQAGTYEALARSLAALNPERIHHLDLGTTECGIGARTKRTFVDDFAAPSDSLDGVA